MSGGPSLVLTWAGIVSVPREPHEVFEGLSPLGHRMYPSHTGCQDSQASPRELFLDRCGLVRFMEGCGM